MKIFKLINLSFLVFAFYFSSNSQSVFAQNKTSPTVVAEVNISGAKIEDQVKNVFSISFSLSNGKGVQSDVHYSVRLSPKGKNAVIADEKIYEETLVLSENSKITKTIVYEAPTTISGAYSLSLFVGNTYGLPLGYVSLGDINLSATEKGLVISSDLCSLVVEGDGKKKSFPLSAQPLINPGQTLKLSCSVVNSTPALLTLSPKIETYTQTLYGEKVDTGVNNFDTLNVKPGEKKSFEVKLPLAQRPQIYRTLFSFGSNSIDSNEIIISYNISGFTANIYNISPDKDVYMKGDIASVGILWGVFGKAVTSADVEINSGNGALCGKESVKNPTSSQNLLVSIKRKCFDPKITLSLKDKDGTTIVERYTSTKTTSQKDNSLFAGKKGDMVIVGIIILITLIGIWMKKKNVNKNIVGGMAVFVLISLLPLARADAYTYPIGTNGDMFATVNVYNVSNPGSTTYNQGDTLRVDGYIQSNSSVNANVSLAAVTVGNSSVSIFNPSVISVGPSNPFVFGDQRDFIISVPTTPPLPQTFSVDFSAGVEKQNIEILNDSLATVLTDLKLNLVQPTIGGGYPVLAGEYRQGSLPTDPFVDVYLEWFLEDYDPGGHINIIDTNNNIVGCVVQQAGNPNPNYSLSGVDMTGPGYFIIQMLDGESCL